MEIDEPIFLLNILNPEDGKRKIVKILIVPKLNPGLFVGPDDNPKFYPRCLVVSLRRVQPNCIVFVVILFLEVRGEAGEVVEGQDLAGVE